MSKLKKTPTLNSNLEAMRDSMVTDFGDASDNGTVKPSSDKSDDCDTSLFLFYYWREHVEPWSALRAVQRQERRPERKEHKHSRVGREHPQVHWRVACRVQHTHMPAYWIQYLREYGGKVKSYTYRWTGGATLTSDFSILFWASTCMMISFMLVSRTIPPITISARMLWT